MTLIRFFVLIVVVCGIFMETHLVSRSMEMIPERAEIVYDNPKYIHDNSTVSVRRAARGGKYVVHVTWYNKQLWANNVSMSYKFCDFVNKDPYGRLILNYGVICPLPSRFWDLKNATIAFPSFPYVFPFTKCKAEVVIKRMIPTEEVMARGFLYLNIKQT